MSGVKRKSGNTKVGKSGFYGVSWHQPANKWMARIRVSHEQRYIGVFENILDAARAYDKEAKKLGKRLLNNV